MLIIIHNVSEMKSGQYARHVAHVMGTNSCNLQEYLLIHSFRSIIYYSLFHGHNIEEGKEFETLISSETKNIFKVCGK